MHGVVPADLPGDEEEFGTIRLLADAEYIERFGMAQPGRAPASHSTAAHPVLRPPVT